MTAGAHPARFVLSNGMPVLAVLPYLLHDVDLVAIHCVISRILRSSSVPSRLSRLFQASPAASATMRIRARLDYLNFAMKRLWPLGVGIAGFLIGVATFISNQLVLVLSLVALILGLGVFIIDAMAARRMWSRFKCVNLLSLFPTDKVELPLGYQDSTYLAFEGRGTMLVHSEADRILQGGPLPIKLDPTPYDLPNELRDIAPLALRTIRSGRVIFNGRILGLRDDLLPGVTSKSRPLRLMESTYFMQACSGELCQFKIVDQITEEEMEVRLRELVAPSGRLVTLSESRLANNIGISTVAFTSDGSLLMVHQSESNVASPRLYAPSGSGSLHPNDLKVVGEDSSLQDLLAYGMEREMSEETGISTSDIINTKVVGFGRWLERGAKPEFFGLTRLKITSRVASEAKINGAEKIYTEKHTKPVSVDLDKLRGELRNGYTITAAPSCPEDIRNSGSLPLIASLRAAALYGSEWLRVPS
jgi:hypothetical protein